MSFGLGNGRDLDDAPGVIGITRDELPALPDAALTDPAAGRLDPRRWFRDPALPFEIEIGPGKGSFLLAHGRASPRLNVLGIEWQREFYLYTADRVRRASLANVRVLHADASEFLRWRVADGVVRVIHLYFSDPWPKPRHHKNRVVQDRFLAEAHRVLAPGGELRVVTDHDELWAWDEAHFARACDAARPGGPLFERHAFTPPEWVDDGEVVGTNYERKMCVDRPPHSAVLVKPLG
jgi:tRNA (guanine-N7-)-methyltransferase